jgi:type I restriction enzyme S subunit
MLKRIKIGDLIKQKKAHSQTGPFGTQLKASDYVEEGIPVINVRNIGFGEIRENQLEYLDDEMAKILKSHRLIKNDIVFGRKGAVERHSLISVNEEGWIQGSDCIRLRFLNNEYNPTFISYFFRTEQHKQWMTNLGSFGATMGSLNQDIISKIEIPDISLTIQNKIASILSSYDELIENNKQRIKLLQEMAEEIYKEWFVRFRFPGYENTKIVDGLPEGWNKKSVFEIIERFPVGKKYDNNTALKKGNVPILDQGQSGLIGYHNDEPSVFANIDDPIIIFANHTCYQRLIQFDFSAIQNILPFKSNDEYRRNIFWLHYATKDIIEFNDYKGHWPEFSNKKIVLPDEKNSEIFGDIIKPIVNEIYILEQKNQVIQETRDLLLPRLISGKLSVEHLIEEELKMVAEPRAEYK